MKHFLFIIIFAATSHSLFGQTVTDTISLNLKLTGYKFFYRGEQIKANDVYVLMDNNDLAYDEFNASREAYIFGSVFAVIGTSLILYPFIDKWVGNKPNYGAAVAGACFMGISIPIFRGYHKKTVAAINLYNHPLPVVLPANDLQGFYIGTSDSGLGLKYRF